ncbi:MAG TPA: long-chain fatty acid--CoA ligase [Geminicoccaceae bacterium]|nr:long-chain fatty acid--CoA ligase [Geminicoccaceae bacterium]
MAGSLGDLVTWLGGRLGLPPALLAGLLRRPADGPAAPDGAEDAEPTGPHPWLAFYPADIDWHAPIPRRPLSTLLDEAVAAHADRPCLEFLGRTYTYREVGDLVARAARGFQQQGVGRGVRVGLFLPNCPYYVICYFAVLKAGGTVVNFNPLYARRAVAHQVKDAGVRVMVTLDLEVAYPKVAACLGDAGLERIVVCRMGGILPLAKRALFSLMSRREVAAVPDDDRHVPFARLIANDGAFEPVEVDPERDVAVLQYTGGTTGTPKGAMLSHGNLYANSVQVGMWVVGLRPGRERVLAVLPLCHVFGMTGVMNVGLAAGAELILVPRFRLQQVLKVISTRRPTVLIGVPSIYAAINERRDLARYDLSSLERCISGGAALPLEVKQKFEELTGCTLVEGYGLTEASPVCTVNPFTSIQKPGSIGLPLPGTVIEITSIDDPDRRLRPGRRGEICVSGPQVMLGYWNHPEETAEALRGGRLHTGDVGYVDREGYVYLIDRIKDLIITGGFNVYPRMVEEAILLHPAVAEVTVCGVPDRYRGEAVKAYVRPREGARLTAAELRAFLVDKLSPIEMPRQVEFRDALPHTFVGKVARRELLAEEMRRLNAAAAADEAEEPVGA